MGSVLSRDRADVLCFRSAPLERALTVIGEPRLDLHIICDRQDSDLVARLCVEEPTGAVICLSLGSIRCRFRNSASTPEPLSPGDPTSSVFDLGRRPTPSLLEAVSW
ncbi:MAG: hypothetical protein CME13_14965 [Gemmatimonadetes bacterium]|nr:hypothetical protein [Gemmatimonadota bacterium]HCV24312.1 hypothetical protein [Candidatus Latescibacterota bacterium]